METHLLYSKSKGSMLILLKNILTEISRIMFDQVSGYFGPNKLTYN